MDFHDWSHDDGKGPSGRLIGVLLILAGLMAGAIAWRWNWIMETFYP